MNCRHVLDTVRSTLLENKEMYLQPKEVFNNIPFWNTVEKYDGEFQKEYGLCIL